jgi:hypothetical protein
MNSTPGGGHVPSADLVEPTGFDASGTVGLRLGRTNTDVRVRLEREWRAAMVGYGAVIAGAAITAATGVGAPAGVAFALLAASSAITALGVALNGRTTVTNTAIASNSALMTRFDDSTGFRGGAWPRSTALDPSSPAATSFADGSLSDGDDTDWHLQ